MEHTPEIKELLERFDPRFHKEIYTPEEWHPHILQCHKELNEIDPDYLILQIKEKYNGLRYYFSTTHPERHSQMGAVVRKYEEAIQNL